VPPSTPAPTHSQIPVLGSHQQEEPRGHAHGSDGSQPAVNGVQVQRPSLEQMHSEPRGQAHGSSGTHSAAGSQEQPVNGLQVQIVPGGQESGALGSHQATATHSQPVELHSHIVPSGQEPGTLGSHPGTPLVQRHPAAVHSHHEPATQE
jgi:hypothetical protein